MKEGFILINKPRGITSFDVIFYLRKITGIKKIGHAGTLDPLATGVLVCAIGRGATKKINSFLKQDKIYLAKIKLGAISSTFDLEGEIETIEVKRKPSLKKIVRVLKKFKGDILQTPPLFSAKKIKGVRAYQLARRGINIKLEPSQIKINKIKVMDYQFPFLKIEINCSSGTYIRSLAHDIGSKLGVGGFLFSLKRISSGDFQIKKAIGLKKINKKNWKNYLLGI